MAFSTPPQKSIWLSWSGSCRKVPSGGYVLRRSAPPSVQSCGVRVSFPGVEGGRFRAPDPAKSIGFGGNAARRCMKLSMVRSGNKSAWTRPVVNTIVPGSTRAPSIKCQPPVRGWHALKICSASSTPAITPGCFTNNFAVPVASVMSMVARVVWSPPVYLLSGLRRWYRAFPKAHTTIFETYSEYRIFLSFFSCKRRFWIYRRRCRVNQWHNGVVSPEGLSCKKLKLFGGGF